MNVESRLLSETDDPLERTLLREAREYRASDSARAATLAALGLGGPPPGSSSGGANGSGALGAGKVVLGIAAVGVAAAVVYFAFVDSNRGALVRPPPPATATAIVPPVVQPTAPRPTVAPETSAAPPPPAVSVAVPPASTHVVPPVAPVAPRDTGPSLGDEVVLIDRARAALYDHDKEATLRALDEYDRRFPPSRPGRMAPEAKSLRERALRLP